MSKHKWEGAKRRPNEATNSRVGWHECTKCGSLTVRNPEWYPEGCPVPDAEPFDIYAWKGGLGEVLKAEDLWEACSAPGQDASEDVEAARLSSTVLSHLTKLEEPGGRDALRAELREYGCWDTEELSDDAENERRIIWTVSWDIREGLDT